MTISLLHATQAVGTYADDGELGTLEWNEEHTLTMSADYILGRATSGTGAVEEIPCTAAGRALLDDANAAAQRTTLGLGTSATYDIGTSGSSVALTNGDNVWTGVMRIGDGTGDAYMRINGAAGYDRGFYIRSNNVNRWFMGGNSSAEAGSNAGTDFTIWRNDDAGTYIDTPLRITRSTGRTTLKELSLTTVLSVSNGGTGGATAADARTNLGLGTSDSPQFTAVNVGAASDTTLSRLAAGTLGVEGKSIPYVFAQSAVAATIGAVTTETALATISIPAGALGPNGFIELWTWTTVTSNANSKTQYVRLGGAAGTAVVNAAVTTNSAVARLTIIANRNNQSSQVAMAPSGNNSGGMGQFGAAYPTAAIDTSAAWDLVISGQKANSADTYTLEAYKLVLHYGA